MICERVEYWIRRNRRLPQKLVIYRDGLSEEQFDMCRTIELPKIKAGVTRALLNTGTQGSPKILLICTVKRHHTRFFQDENGTFNQVFDNNGNPLPGCMVNNTVTIGDGNDFFLYSHATIQGTAKPTHYVVLEDELGETLNNIAVMVSPHKTWLRYAGLISHTCEDLITKYQTHSLCYMFQRATRSVSLAPPACYADLAADRARCYARSVYVPWTPGVHPAGMNLNLHLHANMVNSMFYI